MSNSNDHTYYLAQDCGEGTYSIVDVLGYAEPGTPKHTELAETEVPWDHAVVVSEMPEDELWLKGVHVIVGEGNVIAGALEIGGSPVQVGDWIASLAGGGDIGRISAIEGRQVTVSWMTGVSTKQPIEVLDAPLNGAELFLNRETAEVGLRVMQGTK